MNFMNHVLAAISAPVIILVVVVIVLIFGANKLPELARGIVRARKELKKATDEVEKELETSEEDEMRKDARRKIIEEEEREKMRAKIEAEERAKAEEKDSSGNGDAK